MKHIALTFFLLLQLIFCHAKDLTDSGANKETTYWDRWNNLVEEAKKAAGAIKDYGRPRLIKRGATPEIILSGGEVRYNGKLLRLGASIDEWSDILGRNHRDYPYYGTSTWDDLGIELVIDKKDKKTVIQMTIYVTLEPPDPYRGLVTHHPDGTPIKPTYDTRPQKPFPGYLELDNFGIDAETKFWEIRQQASADRNFSCALDCSHPYAYFSDSANLFMRLNSGSEYGELYELGIGGQAESLRAALRSKK